MLILTWVRARTHTHTHRTVITIKGWEEHRVEHPRSHRVRWHDKRQQMSTGPGNYSLKRSLSHPQATPRCGLEVNNSNSYPACVKWMRENPIHSVHVSSFLEVDGTLRGVEHWKQSSSNGWHFLISWFDVELRNRIVRLDDVLWVIEQITHWPKFE